MINRFFLISLVFVCHTVKAQYETNWWYFGDSLSIDFKKGKVAPTLQIKVPQTDLKNASSACISDKNGNFLFTLNNGFIRDANNQMMSNGNGIKNGQSRVTYLALNSSFAVKKPGNNADYFIFYQDSIDGNNYPGFNKTRNVYYSVVDMSLNGGLGAVTIKNAVLFQSNSFKVDATYHSNGKDVWVLFQKTGKFSVYPDYTNQYAAFLVKSTGMQSPIISNLKNNIRSAEGELKFSPQGDIFAVSVDKVYFGVINFRYQHQVHMLLSKFNTKTGKCFSDIKIDSRYRRYTQNSLSIEYGNICFSPDGKKLYSVFDVDSPQTQSSLWTHHLTQLDISVYNKDSIESKKFQYKSPDSSRIWKYNGKVITGSIASSDIQLGLDGKIYWKTGEKSIGRINQPNIFGTGSNFTDSVFVLPHDTTHFFEYFPAFFSGYFKFSKIFSEQRCTSDTTKFALLDTSSVASVIWDFGDGSALQTANPLDTVKHSFQQSGTYSVKAYTTHYRGTRDTVVEIITVDTIQIPILSDTLVNLCVGDTLKVWNTKTAKHFFWGDTTFIDTFLINKAGKYWYTSYNQCGEWYDSLEVDSAIVPEVNLGRDTVFCSDTILLNAAWKSSTYLWQDQSRDSTLTVSKTGDYKVTVTNKCGVDSAKINIIIQDTLYPDLGKDTAMCAGDRLVFILNYPGAAYTWFNGWSSNTNLVTQPGIYWVEVSNRCGTQSDTIKVDTLHPANINLGKDTATCSHLPLTLNAGAKDNKQTNLSWFWPHNGSRDSSLVVNASGTYTVEVTDQCGTQTHSIKVSQLDAPNLQLKDTSICKGDSVRLTANVDSAQIRWSTGDTVAAVWIKDFKTYGVGAVNRCGSDSVKFKVAELLPPKFELPTDTILCNNTSWNVELTQPQSTYLWGNGQTDSKMQINQEGSYAVTITNACGIDNGAVQVKYLNTPVATVSLSLNGKYCPGSPLTLSGSSINKDDTYFWNTVDSSQSILVKKAGTYTLIVSNFCGGDTTTVTPNYYPIKAAFALNQAEHDSPFELEATNQSEGAVDYVWLLDSNKVASTLNLRQRIIAYGKHSISLIASDEFGCSDTALDTVQVFRNRNIPPLLCDFRVDPNPAKDYFVIAASNNDKQVRQVKIFNDIGQEVISTDVSHWKENPFYFEYRLNNLPSGTYLIGLYCEDETKYRRVVIAR